MHPIRTFFHEFEWIHIGLGLVGSVFFLFESLKEPGIVLFIVGAAGMLFDSVGSAIVKVWSDDAA